MPNLELVDGPIEYAAWNTDSPGPTVVLLHEGLGSAGQWGALPALIGRATRLPVIAYSRPGYAGSAGSGPVGADYLHREADTTLPAVLAALEIASPILVGHSDGASIAVIYASANPVRAVVAIAPHIVVEEATLAGIRATAQVFNQDVRPSLAVFHDDPDELFARWSGIWLSDEFAAFDITPEVASVTAPVLALQGARDEYATARQLDLMDSGARGPIEVRLLPGHGHHPHLTDPAEMSRIITTFIGSVLADTPIAPSAQMQE